MPGKGWVHLDPCEAAVDEPLLYQGWGKNQTYILAFTREGVEDVTHTYTSDAAAAVARRAVGPQEFAALLAEATGVLKGGKGAAGQGGGGGGGGGVSRVGSGVRLLVRRRRLLLGMCRRRRPTGPSHNGGEGVVVAARRPPPRGGMGGEEVAIAARGGDALLCD